MTSVRMLNPGTTSAFNIAAPLPAQLPACFDGTNWKERLMSVSALHFAAIHPDFFVAPRAEPECMPSWVSLLLRGENLLACF